LGADILVKRNDEISVADAAALNPSAVLISPGPCTPDKAGITEELVRVFAARVPIFGICLGMQAIAEVYGGRIVQAERIMHGKESEITHTGQGVFEGLPSPFRAIRYHSLVVDRNSIPTVLEVTATADDEEIMGIRHREHDTEGVQFHPESVLTEHGIALIGNWLRRVQRP
jgi:anthranilate synthase/aminodeoxychorismate synthase-like glutamine amidotransferase